MSKISPAPTAQHDAANAIPALSLAPAEKVQRRPYSWPRRSSSYSDTMRRVVSEQGPTYTSADIGVGGSSNPILAAQARNGEKPFSDWHVTSRIINNKNTSSSLRVMHNSNIDWNVTNLRPVPPNYPLERGCLTVSSQPLSVVCNRISTFLRLNSICHHYHDARVDCGTMGLLKFCIFLWKANDDGAVLIEIQRRQGCSIAMQHIKCGLVQAITSGNVPVLTSERRTSPPVDCSGVFPESLSSFHDENLNALGISISLLESNQLDQQQLGMESMVALTNPRTVFARDAKLVAKALIHGETRYGDSLRCAMLSYFSNVQRRESQDSNTLDLMMDIDDDLDDEGEYIQGFHFGSMHNLGLQALSNALQVVTSLENETATLGLVDLASPFWTTVCNALVYNLEVAHYRPREAALSAQCLNLLAARLAPVLLHAPIMERLGPVLPDANEYGKACNLLLEQESHKLMGTMADGAAS